MRGKRLPLLRCERVVDKRRDFPFQIAIRKGVAAAVSQGLELVHANSVASDAAFGSNHAQASGSSPLEISASTKCGVPQRRDGLELGERFACRERA